MTQYAIATDLNRCIGCYTCSVTCKMVNGVAPGSFWTKVLRIGPNPKDGGSGQYPDVEYYYLPLGCQHCADPECTKVCPTQASYKREDGTVQIDKSKCIGCQFCVMACPYSVRYLNEDERVVEKCTLCEQLIAQGELPQCVSQCSGRARFFGDVEQGYASFEGPILPTGERTILSEEANSPTGCVKPYTDSQIYKLPDVGNGPSFAYILRERKWRGGGA